MIVYSYDTQLLVAGALPYRLATHGWWFKKKPDNTYDTSQVDLPTVTDMINRFGVEESPLMIDIEAYNLATEFEHGIEQLRVAASAWQVGSERRRGFYSMLPERSWFVPVRWWTAVNAGAIDLRRQQMRDWRDRNERIGAALWDVIDIVFPSLYAFYPSQWQQWRIYAEANLDEAVRCAQGRQVCPILYPAMPDLSAVPLDAWTMMVKWVAAYPGINAIAIYSPSRMQPDPLWRVPVISLLK